MAHHNVDSFFAEATSDTLLGDAFDFAIPSQRRDSLSFGRRNSAQRKGSFILSDCRKNSLCFSRTSSMRRDSLWAWLPEEFILPEFDSNAIVPVPDLQVFEEDFVMTAERRRSSLRLESAADERRRSSVRIAANDLQRTQVQLENPTHQPFRAPAPEAQTVQSEAAAPVSEPSVIVSLPYAAQPPILAPQASQPSPVLAEVADDNNKGVQPKNRKIRKPVFWTPEDHTKFLAGLEKFGLEKGLGPGGAELMSVYMGNRTILQIKSHFQKHLSDLAAGRMSH